MLNVMRVRGQGSARYPRPASDPNAWSLLTHASYVIFADLNSFISAHVFLRE